MINKHRGNETMRKKKLTVRKKQALVTHQKIYETALRLFRKEGFSGVTINEICEKAGVCKGTFYVYFESKEQVVLDFFSRNDKMYDDIVALELASISDPVEKLMLFGRKALTYTLDEGVEIVQVSFYPRESINRRGRLNPARGSTYRIITGLVGDAQRQGQMRADLNANEIADIIIRGVDGAIHDWCLLNGELDLIGECEKMFAVLLEGLRPH
jgi:AcrR family transcriptional regulator